MAPVKFDDINKVANDILSDDYQAGYQFKAKQKTNFEGAVVTSTIDVFPEKAEANGQTPAKLTWKLPKLPGYDFFSVDKLEVDKKGAIKFEASSDKVQVPGLKVEVKSDLQNLDKVTTAATYTGVADTQIKFETKPLNPQDFNLEVMRQQGPAMFGLKCSAKDLASPDLGVRFQQGPMFASLFVKEKFSAFTAHGFYKVSDVLKVAGTYQHGGKQNGSFTGGMLYDVMKGTALRAKVDNTSTVHVGVKHELQKGFSVVLGAKYAAANGNITPGLQISIE